MFATTDYAYAMIKEINEQVNSDFDIFNQSQTSQISFWKPIMFFDSFLNRIYNVQFSEIKILAMCFRACNSE